MEKIVLKRGLVKRIVIAGFCALILAVTAYVLFGIYEPGQNSVRALSSVVMDVLCLIILAVLIGSFAFGKYEMNSTSKLFLCLLLATVWALFLDFLNWAFDGSLNFDGMTYWFTVGSLCMGSLLACLFTMYLNSYMVRTHDLKGLHKTAVICAIVDVVSFFVTLTLAITKTAFDFVDGHYQTGMLYDVVTAAPVISLFYLTAVEIRYVKKIGIHDVLSAVGYILFMIFGALVEGEYSIGTTYVSVAIADLFIFVMLQNEIIALEKQNVEKWIQKSNTDELTDFYNRNAYEDEMTELGKGPLKENFTYVSMDVNGLKRVNDSLGHTSGDELIVGAAECIKKCLGSYGKLFRIGGDEFVALIYADAGTVEKLAEDLQKATEKWGEEHDMKLTVSCGYVTCGEAAGQTATQMAIIADRKMYEAKTRYYRTTGIERRMNSID